MISGKIIAVRTNKTVYRDGDRCIKLFGEGYSKAGVFSEALNLAYAEETGLNVPKVIDVTSIDGKWAIVTEFIEGKSLNRLMEENPDKTEEYMELFTRLHIELGKKRCPMMCRVTDKITEKVRRSEMKATLRFGLYSLLGSMEHEYDLCHGDFVPANVIIGPDGKQNIIDWSHAAAGPVAADAAKTYLILKVTNRTKEAEIYLKLFTEMSGIGEELIKKWIPLSAASYGIRGNEEEKRFIDACINLLGK